MAKMNKNYGLFGLGLQTAQGTAAAAPVVSFHASGDSNGLSAERSNESIKLTKGNPVDAGTYVSEVSPKFEATTLGFPKMLTYLHMQLLERLRAKAKQLHIRTPSRQVNRCRM